MTFREFQNSNSKHFSSKNNLGDSLTFFQNPRFHLFPTSSKPSKSGIENIIWNGSNDMTDDTEKKIATFPWYCLSKTKIQRNN